MSDSLDAKKKTRFNKLQKKLRREVGRAIADFNTISEGDKVMVCLSAARIPTPCWKSSAICSTAPVNFELVAVNLDQKQPGFPSTSCQSIWRKRWRTHPERTPIPSSRRRCRRARPPGLCSRLRRGSLYGFAEEIGANKIALGHHRDDIVETLFLNMFYGGKMKAMPPKLRSDDNRNIVIRPLAYCREKDIVEFSGLKDFPIIPCNLCGSQENLQRQVIKEMLQKWDREQPGRIENIFAAVQNIAPSQLADTRPFDFEHLEQGQQGGEAALHRLDVVNLFG